MAQGLLKGKRRERLSGNPRLNMPSFADALNRIGFFLIHLPGAELLAQVLHGRLEPLYSQRVHMIIDQLFGYAQRTPTTPVAFR